MVAGLVMAMVVVSFVDVGVTLYAEGTIRTASIVVTLLGIIALLA